jgi:hypothetical protein
MTNKPDKGTDRQKTLPSEADHNRNTPGGEKGLAETGVNEPHIETAESVPAGKNRS